MLTGVLVTEWAKMMQEINNASGTRQFYLSHGSNAILEDAWTNYLLEHNITVEQLHVLATENLPRAERIMSETIREIATDALNWRLLSPEGKLAAVNRSIRFANST